MHLSRKPRSCRPPHLSDIILSFSQVLLPTARNMGVFQSKPAHSHYRLPPLPNKIKVHVPAGASLSIVTNPASIPSRLIDSLLESHTRVLQAAMKPKLFRKSSMEQEKSLKDHSVALVWLEATLSGLFKKLSKLGSEEMKFRGWEGKWKRSAGASKRT